MTKDLSDDQVIDIIEKILQYYKDKNIKKRMARFIDIIGFDKFSQEIIE